MGNIRSRLAKPVKTFNIESRTERLLEKDKPTPAPSFPSTEKQLKVAEELNPDFLKEHYKKDPSLDDRLKQVYVSSQDAMIEKQESARPLPQNREVTEALEFGVQEPDVIPPGKCNLRQALQFLHNYKVSPVENSIQKIAQDYKLDEKVVENIINHYRILNLHLPTSYAALEQEIRETGIDLKQLSDFEGLKKLSDRMKKTKKEMDNEKKGVW